MSSPQWLVERRSVAVQTDEFAMPSSEEEVWRYSRVADLDLSQWAIVIDRSEGVPAEVSALLE